MAKNGSDIAQISVTFDQRLEDTRQLVTKNGSDIAQLSVKFDQLIEENQAFRESQRSQLAAIIVNGQRITRLEQKAS